jgi:hypothetical protein
VTRRVFGLDFSGAKKAGGLIWLAEARQTSTGIRILSCRPAAELPGGAVDRESALAALRAFIAATPNAVFGCDFPFSLPKELIGASSWTDFLSAFTHPDAAAFRDSCCARSMGREPKRQTDRESKTPWCAFNIRLHHQTFHGLSGLLRPLVLKDKADVLPMQTARADRPWLIETCPASTLIHLGCRIPYKGAGMREQRRVILGRLVELRELERLPAELEKTVLANKGGDALDSIIATIATASALREIERGSGGGDLLEGRVYFRTAVRKS